MTAQPIVEYFNVFKNILCRLFPCTVLAMIDESDSSVPKKLSTQALSQQTPHLDTLPVIPCVVSSCWYAVAAYWLLRSEWCSRPALGAQWWIAIISACCARSPVSWAPAPS